MLEKIWQKQTAGTISKGNWAWPWALVGLILTGDDLGWLVSLGQAGLHSQPLHPKGDFQRQHVFPLVEIPNLD